MKPKLPLILAALIISISSIAQNNPALKNINRADLQQLLKEHKNIHFVFTHDSRNPVQFYEMPPQEAIPQQSIQVNTMTSLQSNFHLVKDINAQTDANPLNDDFIYTKSFAILNSVMYFSADDGIHGIQLWRSDGTSAGTYAVTNLGLTIASINEITITQNKIYFLASGTTSSNYQLYVSDGTSVNTFLLKDLGLGGPGVNGSYYLTAIANTVYFFNNENNKLQLWKSTGTSATTILVRDFANIAGQAPFLTAKANGFFYFTIYNFINGRELWRTDGTDVGTFMLKDISSSTDFYEGPFQLTPFKNKLYFSADDGSGRKLWSTDGTSSGTLPVSNTNGVYLPDDFIYGFLNIPFTVVGSNFYTEALTALTGTELYKYSYTGGFKLIKDITSGPAGGTISTMIPYNNGVAFVYTDTLDTSYRLYTSTGSVGNISLIQSNSNYSAFFNLLTAAGSTLYFGLYTIENGGELWKSDGSAGNLNLVKDIYQGATSSAPENLTYFNNKLYFNAASKTSGRELWQTDGTDASTFILKEINSTSTASSTPDYTTSHGYLYSQLAASINGELYFSASKPETGIELYKSNGKESGTVLLKDINKGQNSSSPQTFISRKKKVYFIGSSTGHDYNIYKIDSLNNLALQVSSNTPILSFDIAQNGLIYYIKQNYTANKKELWRSDGTDAGNFLLSDKEYSTSTDVVVTVGNVAFFTANDESGNELWKSDGTIAGTKMIKDINLGAASSSPYALYNFNGNIYFGANDGSGIALWKSNGTNAGTKKLKAIQLYTYYGYADFYCPVKNKLYLSASTLNADTVLWETDGTVNGTVKVKNTQGNTIAQPSYLTNVNGTLFFSSHNNLYKSDGTMAGTVVVKSIPQSYYYLYNSRCVADGKLFFNAGRALWVSDGTDAGTYQVKDYGIHDVSDINNLVAADNIVLFNGYSYKHGNELYAGDATQVLTNKAENAQPLKTKPATFLASVLQNPVRSLLNLSINSFNQQTLHVVISNERGNVIAQQSLSVNKGTTNISLPAANWQTGVYVIKLTGNAGDAVSITVLK